MITKDIALSLRPGQILYHKTLRNADKTPLRARVNGKVKTWKTRPTEFRIPMKHGLKECFYITDNPNWDGNAADWVLTEEEALNKHPLAVGDKVEKTMGVRLTGTVVPRFPWGNSTDGTYKAPASTDVAVEWDDGTRGYIHPAFLKRVA